MHVFTLFPVPQYGMVFQEFESHQASFYLIFYLGKALGVQTPNRWFSNNDIQQSHISHYMYAGVGVLEYA